MKKVRWFFFGFFFSFYFYYPRRKKMTDFSEEERIKAFGAALSILIPIAVFLFIVIDRFIDLLYY